MIETPHHEGVTLIETVKASGQLGPVNIPATQLLLVDPFTTGFLQLRELGCVRLVVRRNASISNHHAKRYHKACHILFVFDVSCGTI